MLSSPPVSIRLSSRGPDATGNFHGTRFRTWGARGRRSIGLGRRGRIPISRSTGGGRGVRGPRGAVPYKVPGGGDGQRADPLPVRTTKSYGQAPSGRKVKGFCLPAGRSDGVFMEGRSGPTLTGGNLPWRRSEMPRQPGAISKPKNGAETARDAAHGELLRGPAGTKIRTGKTPTEPRRSF